MLGIAVPGTSDGGSTIQLRQRVRPVRDAAGDVAAHAHAVERHGEPAAAAGDAGDRVAAAALVLREQAAAALDVGAGAVAGAARRRGPQAASASAGSIGSQQANGTTRARHELA